jgi:hypothetical protein
MPCETAFVRFTIYDLLHNLISLKPEVTSRDETPRASRDRQPVTTRAIVRPFLPLAGSDGTPRATPPLPVRRCYRRWSRARARGYLRSCKATTYESFRYKYLNETRVQIHATHTKQAPSCAASPSSPPSAPRPGTSELPGVAEGETLRAMNANSPIR